MGLFEFKNFQVAGLPGEVYFAGPPGGGQPGFGGTPAGPPGGGQPGFGGPPGGSGPSWGQPAPQSSGPNKGVLFAVGGMFVALLLFAGAVLFVVLGDDSDELNQAADSTLQSTPTTPATATEPTPQAEPAEVTEPVASQAVADGEFPLSLEEVDLPSNSAVTNDSGSAATKGYCGESVSNVGLVGVKFLEFEAPGPVPSPLPESLSQSVMEFDSPENARTYFDDIVRDNECETSVYTRDPGDTFDHVIEVQSPSTVYGDDTLEISVNAIGGQTGDQIFFTREFVILDGEFVYFSWLQAFEEFPRFVITDLLDKSASNLGLA